MHIWCIAHITHTPRRPVIDDLCIKNLEKNITDKRADCFTQHTAVFKYTFQPNSQLFFICCLCFCNQIRIQIKIRIALDRIDLRRFKCRWNYFNYFTVIEHSATLSLLPGWASQCWKKHNSGSIQTPDGEFKRPFGILCTYRCFLWFPPM